MTSAINRREFLKTSSVAAATTAATATASELAIGKSAHPAGSDVLRIGLIGCGGRGTGAATDAMGADSNTHLVAMADMFEDRLSSSLRSIKNEFGDRVTVSPETSFTGFDAYQKLLASKVDVVLLATPPHFRPIHLAAAIEAGKHVFCEKPVAVDAYGVRSVLATAELAAKKNLNLVSGLCWRYDLGVLETMKRVLGGEIGDIIAVRETYNTGTLWQRPRQPSWTEMEFQLRNWLYFTWLSGDHIVEQHVHSLDKASWTMHDEPPVRAWGLGGRQVRTDPRFGDIFDHHAVCYEYATGQQVFSYCRQMDGCSSDVADIIFGTKGQASVLKNSISDSKGNTVWQYKGKKPSMYHLEHVALFNALREGKVLNNGLYMSRSTMLAILGRMVTHSGKTIEWNEAINSQQRYAPDKYAVDGTPPIMPDKTGQYPVAVPGRTGLLLS